MLAGDVRDALEHLARVHRTGGVIRVDHHDRFGAVGDLGADVLERRVPIVLLVAHIVHDLAARQGGGRGPQRVVGGGDEDLVAIVEQGLRGHADQLGHAVAQVDIVDVDRGEVVDHLVAGDHSAARGRDALGRGVALGRGQIGNHVAHDHIRRLEAEDGGVTRVQLQNGVAVALHLLRRRRHRPADVVEHVLQLLRLVEVAVLL